MPFLPDGIKLSPKPLPMYFQLETKEHNSVEFLSNHGDIYLKKNAFQNVACNNYGEDSQHGSVAN